MRKCLKYNISAVIICCILGAIGIAYYRHCYLTSFVSKCEKCPRCRSGFVYFVPLKHSCYHFSSKNGTFLQGIAYCRNLMSDLVSIETKIESHCINYHLTGTNDLGLYWTSGVADFNRGNTRSFHWLSTGEAFTFTNWCPGQPDRWKENDFCILLITKCWNDVPCQGNYQFLCEYNLLFANFVTTNK
uniref:C-type lectin domain-containing protein n=1 Tax=Strigamia maritima TaxID=126957 RepID=T1J2G1_STRMM